MSRHNGLPGPTENPPTRIYLTTLIPVKRVESRVIGDAVCFHLPIPTVAIAIQYNVVSGVCVVYHYEYLWYLLITRRVSIDNAIIINVMCLLFYTTFLRHAATRAMVNVNITFALKLATKPQRPRLCRVARRRRRKNHKTSAKKITASSSLPCLFTSISIRQRHVVLAFVRKKET